MAIKGAEGMSDDQIVTAINGGARVVEYRYCFSIVVFSYMRSTVILLRPGQNRVLAGVPYTLLSLLVGWWGFPWGIVYTLAAVVGNIVGGKDLTSTLMKELRRDRALAELGPGTQVMVPWEDGQQYAARVVQVKDDQILVEFADGRREWVPVKVIGI
jgi:hypothetical protein